MNREQQAHAFFSGQLTPEEAREHLEWLMSNASEQELSEQIESAWNKNYKKDHPEFNIKDALRRIRAKTGYYTLRTTQNRSTIHWVIRVAAAVTILTIATFVVYQQTRDYSDHPKTGWITKQNPAGQKSKIHLPDGSVVNLNAGSLITYPEEFINDRTVTLIGEAFFDVMKDTAKPFSVKSKEIITTALGTSFNISAYEGEDFIKVTLATGKIQVVDTISQQRMQLTPGQGIIKKESFDKMEAFELNPGSIAVWRQGILSFNQTPLPKVIRLLENWYGVKISVAGTGSTDEIYCSGSFDNEYLNNVLDVLSHSVGFKFEIDNKNVTIELNQQQPMD